MLNQFIWIIYPYLCLTIFIIGHLARYKYDQFSWTAKSSELIETIKMGQFIVSFRCYSSIFGHVVGLLVPANWLEAVGVNNHIYHIGAVYIGIFWYNNIIRYDVTYVKKTYNQNVRRLSSFQTYSLIFFCVSY